MMSNPSLPPLPEPVWPLAELDELARSAGALLDASLVWLVLRNRHGQYVVRIALESGAGGFVAMDHTPYREFIAGVMRSLTNRQDVTPPVGIADLHARPETRDMVRQNPPAMRSLAAVTLLNASETDVFGALIVTSSQVEPLTERRRKMLEMFARQTVMTIRLSAAAESNAAQANELGAILIASTALTASLNPDDVIRGIIHSIQGVVTCDSALIYRYDESARRLRIISSLGIGAETLEGITTSIDDRVSLAARVARDQRPLYDVVNSQDELGGNTSKLVQSASGEKVALLCIPLTSKGRVRGVASLARVAAFSPREVTALARLAPIAAAALENVDMYRAEQAARRQQEVIFGSASDGFALVDDGLRFLQVNDAFAQYLAADPKTLIGQGACDVFAAATGRDCLLCGGADHRRCLLREAVTTRSGRSHVECVVPAPEPSSHAAHASVGPQPHGRDIDFSLTPIESAEHHTNVLLVGRDVSAAREVERVRAQFINMTSHEMGTPLQTISGNIEMFILENARYLAPEQLYRLRTALATTRSMSTFAQDLRLLSERDANQWSIAPQSVDLAAEAAAAIDEIRLSAEVKGVALAPLHAAPALPPAWVDPRRARQVARNLISNAIKYTARGGSVRVSVAADADWVRLSVQDTGIGIPPELQPRIWERYYRVPLADGSEPVSGQGLGLAIVRIITEAHGGKRNIESVLGQGTTITISFPRADRRRS
jgi:signal transduction histidine kinase